MSFQPPAGGQNHVIDPKKKNVIWGGILRGESKPLLGNSDNYTEGFEGSWLINAIHDRKYHELTENHQLAEKKINQRLKPLMNQKISENTERYGNRCTKYKNAKRCKTTDGNFEKYIKQKIHNT